jgi:proline iminopeptidase
VLVPNGLYLVEDFARLGAARRLVFYDVRNRGRSDQDRDPARLQRGIEQDVDDLDAVRRHFGAGVVSLIGHSYVGVTVALYAMRFPAHVRRVVQIGPIGPNPAAAYPPGLTNEDATLRDALARLRDLEKQRSALDAEAFCRKFWEILRVIYVTNPSDAGRIAWGRCELPNERGFMKTWIGSILPSLQRLGLTREVMARAAAPVLTIHGTKDRSAPYGAGRDWAMQLPNARLLTVPGGGHAPWIEAPDLVFEAIAAFLDGNWPADSEEVDALVP